jgi:hypothetical protein
MIKSMLKLNNDVRAKAGEFLVLHENGNVYVVDEDALSSLLGVKGENEEPWWLSSKEKPEPKRRKPTKMEIVDDLLLRGRSVNDIAVQVGVSRKIVGLRRAEMVEAGFLAPLTKKTPVKHHWYKSAEALEAARERARHAWRVRMAKFAKKETGK